MWEVPTTLHSNNFCWLCTYSSGSIPRDIWKQGISISFQAYLVTTQEEPGTFQRVSKCIQSLEKSCKIPQGCENCDIFSKHVPVQNLKCCLCAHFSCTWSLEKEVWYPDRTLEKQEGKISKSPQEFRIICYPRIIQT